MRSSAILRTQGLDAETLKLYYIGLLIPTHRSDCTEESHTDLIVQRSHTQVSGSHRELQETGSHVGEGDTLGPGHSLSCCYSHVKLIISQVTPCLSYPSSQTHGPRLISCFPSPHSQPLTDLVPHSLPTPLTPSQTLPGTFPLLTKRISTVHGGGHDWRDHDPTPQLS
ncbi:hypothetical protein XELAEV_18029983mg [Xenopus laevis]|uniref:Uncharacterized protein n=1 Tax=Xenopus laevis TaxID=8355 RepID=A0A974CSP2_XENLA|nr:hypothetical protein XELAEV_18029983mg [Xenopus laevis]